MIYFTLLILIMSRMSHVPNPGYVSGNLNGPLLGGEGTQLSPTTRNDGPRCAWPSVGMRMLGRAAGGAGGVENGKCNRSVHG